MRDKIITFASKALTFVVYLVLLSIIGFGLLAGIFRVAEQTGKWKEGESRAGR
jgi:hypothetical protein